MIFQDVSSVVKTLSNLVLSLCSRINNQGCSLVHELIPETCVLFYPKGFGHFAL